MCESYGEHKEEREREREREEEEGRRPMMTTRHSE
jgi:hypothetical protein